MTFFTCYMNIYFPPCKQSFGSNTGYYHTDDGNVIETYTKMFRTDLDWERFTDFAIKHFKDKDKVQFIQFAASDGSEAYTQIISMLEHKGNNEKFFPIEAYDINKGIYNAAKSGLLNLNNVDELMFSERNLDLKKYFELTDNNLTIKRDDLTNGKTYKVAKTLTDRVNFHNADMYDILYDLEDNSDTIVMCRNILGYFNERELDLFTTLAACQLRKGSLFITGSSDNPDTDFQLQRKGFLRIMPCVYMQT